MHTLATKSSTLRTYNTPNLYVFKLTYTAGVLTSVAVYSDPTAGQSTAPTADFTVSGLTGIGAINTFGVNSPSGQVITIDEIRTGGTFGSVVGVPLPSAPIGLVATPGNGQVGLSWTALQATGSPYRSLQYQALHHERFGNEYRYGGWNELHRLNGHQRHDLLLRGVRHERGRARVITRIEASAHTGGCTGTGSGFDGSGGSQFCGLELDGNEWRDRVFGFARHDIGGLYRDQHRGIEYEF